MNMDTLTITVERTEARTIKIPVAVFALYFAEMQPGQTTIEEALARLSAGESFNADAIRWTFDATLMVTEAIVAAVREGQEPRCTVGDVRMDETLLDAAGNRLYSATVLDWLRQWRKAQA